MKMWIFLYILVCLQVVALHFSTYDNTTQVVMKTLTFMVVDICLWAITAMGVRMRQDSKKAIAELQELGIRE